jgi:DNA-directed RNA polymerase subunit RPC12/RpoP
MHYIRKIEQDKTDVRSKSYYVYKCSICNEEHWFNWTSGFDTERLRKCPNCGVENDTSNKEYLIKRKHELEQKIKSLSDEREKALSALDKVSVDLEVALGVTQKQEISEAVL